MGDCVKACSLCCAAVTLLGGVVTLLAFTIKALVDDWHLEATVECPSHMRVYLVTLLVSGFVVGCIFGGKRGDDEEDDARAKLRNVVGLFLSTGLSIWGWVEALHLACSDTTDSVRFSVVVQVHD